MASQPYAAHGATEREREIRRTAGIVTGGSVAESIGGAGGLVLAILGLAGIDPRYTGPVAAIAIGGALVLQGGAVGARFRQLLAETNGGPVSGAELGGGVSVDFLGGAAVILLGVLALLRVEPGVLQAVAAIVLGGTVFISSGVVSRLNSLAVRSDGHRVMQEIARDFVGMSAGAQILAGAGAIVLGILSLAAVGPPELTLVAFLVTASSIFLSGAALGGRMGTTLAA